MRHRPSRPWRRAAVLLASLALAALGAPRAGAAQGTALPRATIEQMVRRGYNNDNILNLARANCLSFVVDSVASVRLRAAGATAELVTGLRGTCYRGSVLQVNTEPAGATVRLEGREVGVAPWSGRVGPGDALRVGVSTRSGWSRDTVLRVGQSELVTIQFDVPTDTLSVQNLSRQEVDRLRAAINASAPLTPRPVRPEPPRRGAAKSWLLGGLLGVVAGGAVGYAACSYDVQQFRLDPDLGYGVPDELTTKRSGSCLGIAGGVGAVGGALGADLLSRRGFSKRQRSYEAASAAYPAELRRWEDQERAARQSQATQLDERERRIAENERIKARNRALSAPVVQREPARKLPSAAP